MAAWLIAYMMAPHQIQGTTRTMLSLDNFDSYSDFVGFIETVADSYRGGSSQEELAKRPTIETLLNGANAKAVSHFLDSAHRKHNGIFFTGEALANKVAQRIKPEIMAGKSIYDPACGSGDLLLACTQYLPIQTTLAKTLKQWSQVLLGTDLFEDFIRSAKSRLLLAAIYRSGFPYHRSQVNSPERFEQLQTRDFFAATSLLDRAECIVTNPPYGHIDLTDQVAWKKGKGQLAALFIDRIIQHTKNKTRVVAILPDVLRSGSGYKKWRRMVNQHASSLSVELCGRFDSEADVDVFILDFVVTKNNCDDSKDSFEQLAEASTTLQDYFSVAVGPVVPHRATHQGPWVRYADTRNTALWQASSPEKSIRFKGTLFSPPFVVVRRTSSPNDKIRLNAAIIQGDKPVAVENHLIVIKPLDNNLRGCRQFLQFAQSNLANNWVNQRIRCRHLTVGTIRHLPWPQSMEPDNV